jgi:hypothetical protein
MTVEHSRLAGGRWAVMSLSEQMANIGGEVERALNWRSKNNPEYAQKAFERALELMDLSLGAGGEFSRLRELARLREAWVDYFFGSNEYGSNENLWRAYFNPFVFAARKHV